MSISIGKKAWFVPSLFADPVPVIVTGIENVNPNLKNRLYLTAKTSDGKIISGYVQQFSTSKPTPYNAPIETETTSVYYDKHKYRPVTLDYLEENFDFYRSRYKGSWKTVENMIEQLTKTGILIPYAKYLLEEGLNNENR